MITEDKLIVVDPDGLLTSAIYACFGEWEMHVQQLLEQHGDGLQLLLNDEEKMREFIRRPMQGHFFDWSESHQNEFRRCLQFLLVKDEFTPYVASGLKNPNWKEKRGSLAQKIRDNCPDTIAPYDGYAICQWMWETLFGTEDWHVDTHNWVVR